MIYLSLEAKKQIIALCYYPHVSGKHLERLNYDLSTIDSTFEGLMSTAMPTKVRSAIGHIEYITANNDVIIINIP